MTNNKNAALQYASKGFALFPLWPDTKKPRIEEWQKQATFLADHVGQWWTQWPDAGIGCVPGKSGHVVFDLDLKNGKNGIEQIEALEAIYGPLCSALTRNSRSACRGPNCIRC